MKRSSILLLASILLPISLAAQITFAEKKTEKPDWEYLRETLVLPYDSSYLTIQMYPILEAYKKYVGQQLFLMKGGNERGTYRKKDAAICDDEYMLHKYFEIVDVVSYTDFLEARFREKETKLREKEKELRAREAELKNNIPELQQKIIELQQIDNKEEHIENDLISIESQFKYIDERRKIRNLSLSGHKEVNDLEKTLRKKYDRKKVLDELSEIAKKRNEIKQSISEIRKELTMAEHYETEDIRKELKNIESYFSVGESSRRKEMSYRDLNEKQGTYYFPCEEYPSQQCNYKIKNEDIPYFVLKNVQNQDTIYCTIPNERCILVGGFVKLKEKAVGNNVVACHHSLGLDPEIISMWKCTDVSITSDMEYITIGWGQKNQVQTSKTHVELISLVVQNSTDKDVVGFIRLGDITDDFEKLSGHSCFMFEETYKEYVSAYNKQKQNYKQQDAQAKAKHKQQLTAKYGAAAAEKIMAGKYEIGMSKAVCKEIAGYATIVNKTATTEVWKISNIMGYGATYLYFDGDKLTRIINH